MPTKDNFKKIITAILVVLGIILIFKYTDLGEWLTLEGFQRNKNFMKEYMSEHYLISVIIYILFYTFVVSFFFPGATVTLIAGGFLFGTVPAMVYSIIGATIGGTLSFLFSRYIIGSWIQKKYRDKFKNINQKIKENGKNYALTLRFVPVLPFFMINLLFGITPLPLGTFVWTTAVGVIPGIFVCANAGDTISNINSMSDVFTPRTYATLAIFAAFALLPVLLNKKKQN